MPYTIDVSGQVALITGGTKGIGLAIAKHLGLAGAHIVVASRKADAVAQAISALESLGISASGATCNVGSEEERKNIIDHIQQKHKRLDILVNNAAANPVFGNVEDTSSSAFDKIMSVNVHAPFELAKLALPLLRNSENAHIINISSIGGLQPEPKLGIYSVSKAALNSLTQVLAKEWGRYGVQVNAICPGLIKTDFSAALWQNEKLSNHMKNATPMTRIGTPDDIGKLAMSIVGGMASYATGHIYVADGGYTI